MTKRNPPLPTPLAHVTWALIARAVVVLPFFMLSACTPLSEQEKEYIDARKAEKDTLEAFGTKLATGAEQQAIITQVQDHVNEDGLTEEQWLRTSLAKEQGTMMSYRWSVRKKGDKIYEVQYRYTRLTEQEEVLKQGYAWEVDNVIKDITGPRTMRNDEVDTSSNVRQRTGYRERKRRLAEITLE